MKATITSLAVAIALGASTSSNATNPTSGGYRVDVFQNQEVRTTAIAASESRATAAAVVGPVVSSGGTAAASVNGVSGGAGGTASATGGNGGSATVNFNNAGRRTTELRTVGIAPDMIASPTAPCRIAMGIGGGPMGWAASIFGSTLDEGCDAREDARLLHNLGRQDAAIARLCAKPEMAKALGCEALGE